MNFKMVPFFSPAECSRGFFSNIYWICLSFWRELSQYCGSSLWQSSLTACLWWASSNLSSAVQAPSWGWVSVDLLSLGVYSGKAQRPCLPVCLLSLEGLGLLWVLPLLWMQKGLLIFSICSGFCLLSVWTGDLPSSFNRQLEIYHSYSSVDGHLFPVFHFKK